MFTGFEIMVEDKKNVNKIIELVKQEFPKADVYQLKVKFPADDDGIWYFWLPEFPDDDIQIENSYGQCPFIIETNRDSGVRYGETVEQTASIICEHLKTASNINEK